MTKTNNQTNLRRGGFYWQGSTPYLSVTEILKCIDKPALRYWFGKMVYYAMLKDPSLSQEDALKSPYNASQTAKDRGSTIHSLIEAYKTTGDRLEFVPDHLQGYAEAFYKFMTEHKPEILSQERTLFSEKNKIAGTLDMHATIGGIPTILDVKTGKDVYPEVELQLSAYASMMLENNEKADRIAVLLLETGQDDKPTGNYIFKTLTMRMDVFYAVKTLYCWLNQEKLAKVGYL